MPTPISTILPKPSPPTCPSTKQGQCPAPHTAPFGSGGVGRHTTWPGFYRRSATGLAARESGAAPCRLASADRHSATGLMARARRTRWPMTFQNRPTNRKPSHPARGKPAHRQLRGEQSGDRQRREKGSPILTAEKGEHERAPNVSDSYPTPLRATLRAPPTKWAIKAFFRRVSAASRGRGQPLRAVCPRNVVRLFRPNGRNWMPRINSGRPTVRLPQAEAHGA